VTVNQFTLIALPRIRCFEGSKLRPWIIPAGLGIHVMSHPLIHYLHTAKRSVWRGYRYNIWKNFFVALDGRYQLTAGNTDGVNLSSMTAGDYLGI
jgi:hypothetical protein